MAEGLPNNSTDLQPGNGTPGQHDNKRRPHRDSAESKEIADLARALLNDMLPIVMEPLEAKDNEELERTAAGLVEDMMPHVLAGIEKNETVKTGPEPKVEPKAETEVPLESYMKLAPATPYPPMQEKFRFEAVGEGLAIELRFTYGLTRLTPEGLDDDTSEMILDLSAGRVPVHCVRAGLSERQRMYIWQPIVMNWWEGLSQDAKHDFIAAARREAEPKAPREVEEQMRASRIVGYRRLLGGMFERNPHRMYELYMAVKEGEKLSAPLGFGHEEAENWNKFIVDDWFESLSTEDRLRFDERADRLIRIPEQIKEKQTALSVLLDARKKHLRFFGNVKAFFAHEKDIAQKNFASEEQLNREIAALQQDLVALQTSAVIDELEDIDFARLYGWGERNGSGVAAIDATRNLFRWSRPNARSGMTQSPEGTVLSSLNGTRHNAPAAIEPWMLEAGSARATGMFDAGGAVAAGADATPQELMAHRRLIDKTQPTIDFPAYLLGIQQQIVKELERTIQKTIPLKSAIERDPLKGLLVAYHETIPYVAPELREQQGRVLVFIEEQLAQVEQDLSRRLGNGVQHLSLLPDNDLPWIAALLEERTIDERGTPPAPGTATTQGTETVEMGLRHSMDVDPGRSIKSHVYELIKTFDTTKTGPMLTRETAQFLHKGWVYEAGDKKQRTFMSHGIIQTPIYEGDRLTAIQDSRAPFGFRIEIARNTRRERPGYFEFDQSGKPQTYYQDAGDGVVNVWEADKHQSMKFRGQFEGKRFVDKPERVWMYKTLGERMHPIYEHMNDIYFEADGRVATKLRDLDGHGNRFRELGMLPEPFPAEVAVKKPDGTIVRVFLNDREHAYLVTPRNEVVEYHASVNDVRVLGTIES